MNQNVQTVATDYVESPSSAGELGETQVVSHSGVDTAQNVDSVMALLREMLETFLLAIVLFLVVNTITSRYEVQSLSMEPTLHEGEYLIVSKISYWFRQPHRGDIVVLDPPLSQSEIPYIKRVVGLPGEQVEVRDGRVWINGTALNEPYISGPLAYNGKWTMGEGEYFVLGDNRNNSSDSHAWGVLPQENILGNAVFRYWPLEKWGTFTHYGYMELEVNQ
jgi:signal peptidase I